MVDYPTWQLHQGVVGDVADETLQWQRKHPRYQLQHQQPLTCPGQDPRIVWTEVGQALESLWCLECLWELESLRGLEGLEGRESLQEPVSRSQV